MLLAQSAQRDGTIVFVKCSQEFDPLWPQSRKSVGSPAAPGPAAACDDSAWLYADVRPGFQRPPRAVRRICASSFDGHGHVDGHAHGCGDRCACFASLQCARQRRAFSSRARHMSLRGQPHSGCAAGVECDLADCSGFSDIVHIVPSSHLFRTLASRAIAARATPRSRTPPALTSLSANWMRLG